MCDDEKCCNYGKEPENSFHVETYHNGRAIYDTTPGKSRIVGAVYDRAYFVDSRKNARS